MSDTTEKIKYLGIQGTKTFVEKLKEEYSPLGHNHDVAYLRKDNTIEYTPANDYNPATKKYIDDLTYCFNLPYTYTTTVHDDAKVISWSGIVNLEELEIDKKYKIISPVIDNPNNYDVYGTISVVVYAEDGNKKVICPLTSNRDMIIVEKPNVNKNIIDFYLISNKSPNNSFYTVDLTDKSTVDTIIVTFKNLTKYIPTGNNVEYIPTTDYSPATKKYVDDAVEASIYYLDLPYTYTTTVDEDNETIVFKGTVNLEDLESHRVYRIVKPVIDNPNNYDIHGTLRVVMYGEDGSKKKVTSIPFSSIESTTVQLNKPYDTKWLFFNNFYDNISFTIDFTDKTSANTIIVTENHNIKYISTDNNTEYIPLIDYSPATKKYVDDSVTAIDVQADWNVNDPTDKAYIQNRTHYTETISAEIFSDTVSFSGGGVCSYSTLFENKLYLDSVYTVIWNGTEYSNLIPFEDDDGNINIGCSYTDLEAGLNPISDESAPFNINYNTNDGSIMFNALNYGIDTSYSVVINSAKEEVHVLDEKYIPDTIARTSDVPTSLSDLENSAVLYTEQSLTSEQQMQARKNQDLYCTTQEPKVIINDVFENAQPYASVIDKLPQQIHVQIFKRYDGVLVYEETLSGIEHGSPVAGGETDTFGNTYLTKWTFYGIKDDTGEPILLTSGDENPSGWSMIIDDNYLSDKDIHIGMYTVIITDATTFDTIIHTIPEKYVPDSIARTSDVEAKQDVSNLVTEITSESTDKQYPSATAVKDYFDNNTVLKTAPIYSVEETDYMYSQNINLLDLESRVPYVVKVPDTNKVFVSQLIVPCEDGTQRVVAYPTSNMFYINHYNGNNSNLYINNHFIYFCIDYSDISTADNVVVTKVLNYLPCGNNIEYTPTNDYNPATKKYVDDTVASVDVQSDWDIHDETSKAYIKNRPFYSNTEKSVSLSSEELDYDGVLGYADFVNEKYSFTPIDNEIFNTTNTVTGEFYLNQGNYFESSTEVCGELVLTSPNFRTLSVDVFDNMMDNKGDIERTVTVTVYNNSDTGEGYIQLAYSDKATYPTRAVWFSIYQYLTVYKTLDENFIPDTIARADNLNAKQDVSNLITEIDAESTDMQYPSAKAVYTKISEPKTHFILIDDSTGEEYVVFIKDGTLVSQPKEMYDNEHSSTASL